MLYRTNGWLNGSVLADKSALSNCFESKRFLPSWWMSLGGEQRRRPNACKLWNVFAHVTLLWGPTILTNGYEYVHVHLYKYTVLLCIIIGCRLFWVQVPFCTNCTLYPVMLHIFFVTDQGPINPWRFLAPFAILSVECRWSTSWLFWLSLLLMTLIYCCWECITDWWIWQ